MIQANFNMPTLRQNISFGEKSRKKTNLRNAVLIAGGIAAGTSVCVDVNSYKINQPTGIEINKDQQAFDSLKVGFSITGSDKFNRRIKNGQWGEDTLNLKVISDIRYGNKWIKGDLSGEDVSLKVRNGSSHYDRRIDGDVAGKKLENIKVMSGSHKYDRKVTGKYNGEDVDFSISSRGDAYDRSIKGVFGGKDIDFSVDGNAHKYNRKLSGTYDGKQFELDMSSSENAYNRKIKGGFETPEMAQDMLALYLTLRESTNMGEASYYELYEN